MSPDSVLPRRVLGAVLADHTLLISADTTIELARSLLNVHFDRYVSRKIRIELLRLLPTLAFCVPPSQGLSYAINTYPLVEDRSGAV